MRNVPEYKSSHQLLHILNGSPRIQVLSFVYPITYGGRMSKQNEPIRLRNTPKR